MTMTTTSSRLQSLLFRPLGAALLVAGCGSSALAQEYASPTSVYLQWGSNSESPGTSALTIGATAPMLPGREFLGARLHWDGFVSQWRGDNSAGVRASYTQLGLMPTARWRFSEGRSAWFADAGLGITYLDGEYSTPDHTFSTRWNFTQRVALGRSFGEQGRHELSLALQHFSNAGIEKPNPGENFISLRYAMRF
jgi:lipid A 3-O-deacylase